MIIKQDSVCQGLSTGLTRAYAVEVGAVTISGGDRANVFLLFKGASGGDPPNLRRTPAAMEGGGTDGGARGHSSL